ncbi:MAG: YaeQ family protein [Vicinamibacterales bacterium]
MAQSSTLYTVTADLSDVDRGVYESLDLKLARHPSETGAFLVTRLLAYCLEFEAGIAFGDGLSTADEPAVLVRDATGRITKWIDVGLPSAERVHRGSKLAGRAAIYTHRDPRQVLAALDGQGIHRAAEIPVYAFDRAAIDGMADALPRRSHFTLNVMDRHLYVEGPGGPAALPLDAHRFA